MQIEFNFGMLSAVLASVHDVADDKRTNFQARLKNLHRLDFPKGIGGQPGKAIKYRSGEIAQMALATELTQAGLLPERLVDVYNLNHFPVYMAMSMASRALIDHPKGFDPAVEDPENDPLSMFLFFDPSALAALMYGHDHDEDLASATFFYGGSGIVAENIAKWTTGRTRRLTLINVTAMLWEVSDCFPNFRETFFKEVNDWADTAMDNLLDGDDPRAQMIDEVGQVTLNTPDEAEGAIRRMSRAAGVPEFIVNMALGSKKRRDTAPLGGDLHSTVGLQEMVEAAVSSLEPDTLDALRRKGIDPDSYPDVLDALYELQRRRGVDPEPKTHERLLDDLRLIAQKMNGYRGKSTPSKQEGRG